MPAPICSHRRTPPGAGTVSESLIRVHLSESLIRMLLSESLMRMRLSESRIRMHQVAGTRSQLTRIPSLSLFLSLSLALALSLVSSDAQTH